MGITCSRPQAEEDSVYEHHKKIIEECQKVQKWIERSYLTGHLHDDDLFSFVGSFHGVKNRDDPAFIKTSTGHGSLVQNRFGAKHWRQGNEIPDRGDAPSLQTPDQGTFSCSYKR